MDIETPGLLLCESNVASAGRTYAEYLSPTLVNDQCLVMLGEGLPDLPEDKQAEVILPLAAHCVLRSRHPYE